MIFSSDIETDDLVVEALARGEMRVKEIHKEVQKKHDITLKPVYTAINQLIDAGVVYKKGPIVGLSQEWADRVEERLGSRIGTPELKEGQSVTYSFSSVYDSDRYWKHLTLSIRDVDPRYPVFFLFPNEMWVYLDDRGESERAYMRKFEEEKRYAFMTIGDGSAFTKEFRSNFMGDYFQIETGAGLLDRPHVYTTIIGGFIIETFLPKETAAEIGRLYRAAGNEKMLSQRLNNLFAAPHKMKMRLSHSPEKARELRKRLHRPFYVPKALREEYNLF